MEIPILITGDDATGYTATDCFGRMVQAGTRVDVQTKMMGFLRREILGGSLSILHADGSIPFVPAARSENSNSEGFKLWQEGIAEARREEDMSEARDAQRTSPELVESSPMKPSPVGTGQSGKPGDHFNWSRAIKS